MFFNEQNNLQIILTKTNLLKYTKGKHLYLGIWQHFFAAFFKELALITIREMWGLGLELPGLGLGFHGKVSVSKFEPGLGLGGYGLDYIIG